MRPPRIPWKEIDPCLRAGMKQRTICIKFGVSQGMVSRRKVFLGLRQSNENRTTFKQERVTPGPSSFNYMAAVFCDLTGLWLRDFPWATWEEFRAFLRTKRGDEYLERRIRE